MQQDPVHDFERFLGEVQFPADKRRIKDAAARRNAPEELRDRLERLPDQTYPDLREVRRVWAGTEEHVPDAPVGAEAGSSQGQTSTRPSGTRHG